MKLEGVKVADEGKSLFTNTELEMVALLPVCLVNVCHEVGSITVVHSCWEARGRPVVSLGRGWAPHTLVTSTCPVGWGNLNPKVPWSAHCNWFSGFLGLCWGLRPNRKNWCRWMRGCWGAKIPLFPPKNPCLVLYVWIPQRFWIQVCKTGKDNLETIAKHPGEGFIDLRVRRDYYHHLVWLSA